ncbi:MAG: TIGR00366 family protein [Phycisphaerales bacterium]|nr:TIGR00366 family protein [Phycisphaerales bacterium]
MGASNSKKIRSPAAPGRGGQEGGPLARLGGGFSRISEAIAPDPIVLAVMMTLAVFAAAWFWSSAPEIHALAGGRRGLALVRVWFDGIWSPGLLRFALQMCLVLLTGFGIAKSPPVAAGVARLARSVRSPRSAVMLVAAVSCCGCWLNWGFGLIVGGVLAAELARRLDPDDRRRTAPVLVAAAYSGMMIWHGGLSGSAPLEVARAGVTIGAGPDAHVTQIDVTGTILTFGNLTLSALFIVGVPLLLSRFAPTSDGVTLRPEAPPSDDNLVAAEKVDSNQGRQLADHLNRSRLLSLILAALGLAAIADRLIESGVAAIDLNFVNLLFLAVGLALHRNLIDYFAAVTAGGGAIVGIVIQFPLYAGIQALMRDSGLSATVSQGFVDGAVGLADTIGVSSSMSFPIAAFFSAGLVNFFVPSGGGQWIVQGPIMCNAAAALNLPVERAVMAVAYGDEWTNMIQPFWAIPLMGLTGVHARSFMGYCALLMLMATPVFLLALLLA